ncbi:MAG TPA: ABC transporter permease [Jiangellaceae bacterium]|nr:ABC transporter permease [Jiangellaceae bacterium]
MSAFTGTGRLVRLALRRDRIQLPIWLLALTLTQAATVSSVVGLYPTEQERVALAISTAQSPVGVMFNGLVSGTSLGATAMTQSFMVVAIAAAFMSTLTVVRHTRQNEETGRAELIGAGIVGRHASLTAALIVAVGANVVLGLLNAVVLIGNDLPAAGSFAAAAGIAAVGIAFAAIAAVTAQVSETARGANGMAAAAIGVAFLLRAVGDVSGKVVDGGVTLVSAWPSWLSPIGWGQQIRPYDQDNWWVLGLLVVAFAALVGLSFVLTAHRDVGAGLRAVQPGRPTATPGLLSPLGLGWHLQRGVFIGWAVGTVVLGAAYGSIGDEIEEFIGDSEQMADYFEQIGGTAGLTEAYFAATLGIAGLAVAGYAIQALLRMRSEESAGRVEPVLAASVPRTRWMWSHVAIAACGAVLLLTLMGLSTGLAYGLVVDDVGTQTSTLIGAALVQAPAVLALAGLAVAAFGLLPRLAAAVSWAVLALCVLIGQLGQILGLPQAVLDLSPFSHVPAAPADDVTALPLLALLLVAAALTAIGVASFRRRDLAMT